ncbi:MAG: hypothetical protein PHI55_01485 [Burkholderiaceae bacterium]|nr:hypothetical protein [Burkholderiaceae bacterium]
MFPEQALSAVETQLEAVSAALIAGDPVALQGCTEQLRQGAIALAQAMDGQSGPLGAGLQQRLAKVQSALSAQREGVLRLSAITDRQVAVVLPPAPGATTYGAGLGSSSGAAAARIYRGAS